MLAPQRKPADTLMPERGRPFSIKAPVLTDDGFVIAYEPIDTVIAESMSSAVTAYLEGCRRRNDEPAALDLRAEPAEV